MRWKSSGFFLDLLGRPRCNAPSEAMVQSNTFHKEQHTHSVRLPDRRCSRLRDEPSRFRCEGSWTGPATSQSVHERRLEQVVGPMAGGVARESLPRAAHPARRPSDDDRKPEGTTRSCIRHHGNEPSVPGHADAGIRLPWSPGWLRPQGNERRLGLESVHGLAPRPDRGASSCGLGRRPIARGPAVARVVSGVGRSGEDRPV